MSSQEPTRQETLDQKNYILDMLWRVQESARIWRRLIKDEPSRVALAHIAHATAVLMDRCDLLSIPPRPPDPSDGPFLTDLLPSPPAPPQGEAT